MSPSTSLWVHSLPHRQPSPETPKKTTSSLAAMTRRTSAVRAAVQIRLRTFASPVLPSATVRCINQHLPLVPAEPDETHGQFQERMEKLDALPGDSDTPITLEQATARRDALEDLKKWLSLEGDDRAQYAVERYISQPSPETRLNMPQDDVDAADRALRRSSEYLYDVAPDIATKSASPLYRLSLVGSS